MGLSYTNIVIQNNKRVDFQMPQLCALDNDIQGIDNSYHEYQVKCLHCIDVL